MDSFSLFLQTKTRQGLLLRDLTTFKKLCLGKTPTYHTLSQVVQILINLPSNFTPTFLRQWEAELSLWLSQLQREKNLIWHTKRQLQIKIKRMDTSCFRGGIGPQQFCIGYCRRYRRRGNPEGSPLHLFWACPVIHPFSEGVIISIKTLTGWT